MTRRPTVIAIFAVAAAICPLAGLQAQPDRLVQINVTYQERNAFLPWQSRPPQRRAGFGMLTGPNTVVTTENLVRNATHVEILRPRSGTRYPARVVTADPRVDLALLKLSQSPNPGMTPVVLAKTPAIGDALSIHQLDPQLDVEIGNGTVRRIGVSPLPNAPSSVLAYEVLSEVKIEGQGAPVFAGEEWVGLVIHYTGEERIATVVGEPFLSRFIEDARTGAYTGFASAGFTWKQLVDPAKRSFLGLDTTETGILVLDTFPDTDAARQLKPLDVVLNWDGYAIDALGYYEDPVFGRTEFSHLVMGRRAPGDSVAVTVVRDQAATNLNLTLGGGLDGLSRVPENIIGKPADYLVAGGFVLRELDGHYLRSLGPDWRSQADTRLMHWYLNRSSGDHAQNERIIILTGVLPDPINIGYHHLRGRVVTAVNGVPVKTMDDVFRIADSGAPITRFRILGIGFDIALEPGAIREANMRLARKYGIPHMRSR